ncbi:hypothetical protein ACFL6U_29000, partial [Planctomycetota bacterium]
MSVPYDLLNAYFLETITAEEFAELSVWLQQDPKHVRILVRESILHKGTHQILVGDELRQHEDLVGAEES